MDGLDGAARPPDDRDALLLRLSHDLRAPLGSVVTLCQLLLDGDAGPLSMKQHQYVEVIRRGGQTVLALVDDMLDLVAIDSGRSDIEPELTDIAALARQAADASHPLAREKGIPVQVLAPNRPVAARVDARRLRHVLSRMVEHVVSATDHGYVEVDVEPSASGAVEIAIRNTRDGLSESARRMLDAQPDLEAPATSAAELQAPLPLTVAARIARKLGSPIALRSGEDEGLSLVLSVALARRRRRPAPAGRTAGAHGRARAAGRRRRRRAAPGDVTARSERLFGPGRLIGRRGAAPHARAPVRRRRSGSGHAGPERARGAACRARRRPAGAPSLRRALGHVHDPCRARRAGARRGGRRAQGGCVRGRAPARGRARGVGRARRGLPDAASAMPSRDAS